MQGDANYGEFVTQFAYQFLTSTRVTAEPFVEDDDAAEMGTLDCVFFVIDMLGQCQHGLFHATDTAGVEFCQLENRQNRRAEPMIQRPIPDGIDLQALARHNVPPPSAHAFADARVMGACLVCGKPLAEKSKRCETCAITVHPQCAPFAYYTCDQPDACKAGFASTFEEYIVLAASATPAHFLGQTRTGGALCHTCHREVRGACYRCYCCSVFFHQKCPIPRTCKPLHSEAKHCHYLLAGAVGKCYVCHKSISHLTGFFCAWCKLQAHAKCLTGIPTFCSYGRFQLLFTQPYAKENRVSIYCHDQHDFEWCLFNLNPRQLITRKEDIAGDIVIFSKPLPYLMKYLDAIPQTSSVVVQEGDVGHSFGWHIPFDRIVLEIPTALSTTLDVWAVSRLDKRFLACFGVGLDAAVLRTGRTEPIRLTRFLKLSIDDKHVPLQELSGVLLMNTPFYNGHLLSDDHHSCWDDGLIEVFGIIDFTHLSYAQVNSLPLILLGRGRLVKLVVDAKVDAQLDLQPFVLPSGTYRVTHQKSLRCLVCNQS